MRYRKGVSEQFSSGYDPDAIGPGGAGSVPSQTGYAGYPPASGQEQPLPDGNDPYRRADPYQQPPFGGGGVDQRAAAGDFHPVTY